MSNFDFENRRFEFSIPNDHIKFLANMDIQPKIIYDIGSCVFHWTDQARRIWPDAEIYAFDGNTDLEYYYKMNTGINKTLKGYNLGLLSDMSRIVDYYKSPDSQHLGGNSYYPETLYGHLYKPIRQATYKLDDIVKNKQFEKPDLIKIDVQGSEIDVMRGGKKTFKSCNHLIVELQHIQYNKGAHLCDESIKIITEEFGFRLIKAKFCDNGADADYYFSKL